MKSLPFVLVLALGTAACGSQVQSIRKPPSAMSVLLLAVTAGALLLGSRIEVAQER